MRSNRSHANQSCFPTAGDRASDYREGGKWFDSRRGTQSFVETTGRAIIFFVTTFCDILGLEPSPKTQSAIKIYWCNIYVGICIFKFEDILSACIWWLKNYFYHSCQTKRNYYSKNYAQKGYASHQNARVQTFSFRFTFWTRIGLGTKGSTSSDRKSKRKMVIWPKRGD